MSTSGITFGGLASGLDTQAIITALLSIERRPINALENKKDDLKEQLKLFGNLESKLQTLRDKSNALRQSFDLLEYKADVDREDFLSASAGSGAIAGTYDLVVDQLARAQSNQSNSFTSDTTSVITGGPGASLKFTVGATVIDVPLPGATNSLQEISAAINGVGEGISAQVVKVDDNDYRLVVTGETGEDQAFSVVGTGTVSAIVFGAQVDANNLRPAEDAELTINGLQIFRASNSISDAISGVTLDLVGEATLGEVTRLTVKPDASATASKVKEFVDAYNDVVDFANAQNALDEEGVASSPLFGDSTLRTIRGALRSDVGSSAATSNASYTLFSQIGIKSDQQGKLTFTEADFEAAVAADEDAVVELFTSPDELFQLPNGTSIPKGIALRIYNQVDGYLDKVDGLLISRTNGFNSRIADADRQVEVAERRFEAKQISLERRFANLEILMSQLQSQGASLGGIASAFGSSRSR